MDLTVEEPGLAHRRASYYRLCGRLGLAGGVLAVISNALHPRQGPGNLAGSRSLEDFLDMVAGFGLWRLDHLLIIFSLILGIAAFIGVAHLLVEEATSDWAPLCLPLGLVAGAVGAVSFTLDGFALGELGEAWKHASGPARAEVLARAEAVVLVDAALFTIAIFGLFGVTQLVYGLAMSRSGYFPSWIATTAIAGGIVGIASGIVQWMAGELNVASFLVLFTVSSVLLSVWLIGASVLLTRRV